jgi:adenylate kinase family enzyme
VPKLIVLVSGNVSAGKTTLSEGLRRQHSATIVKTKEVLKDLAVKKLKTELRSERKALQEFGAQQDEETSGEWVLKALNRHIAEFKVGQDDVVVVDAVRILPQIKAIRRVYQFKVKHVHLEASPKMLAKRYKGRGNAGVKELPNYSDVGHRSCSRRQARDARDGELFV